MNSNVSRILLTLLMIFILLCFSGCTTKNEEIEEEQNNENNIISNDVSKVQMNPELDGVYAFARVDRKIVALKENGEEVKIIDDNKNNTNYKYQDIEYSSGKLYLSNYDYSQDKPISTGIPGFSTSNPINKGCMYYAIDLNKGNGNYIPELIYDYIPENEHYIGVDNPKVYNDIMYFVKNSNEIIAYNVITREEKTIKKFKNDTNFFGFKINSSSEAMLDKEKNILYYTGILEDDSVKLFSYNIDTLEEKVIDEGKIFKLQQVTKNGIYYQATDYNSSNSSTHYNLYDIEKNTISEIKNYSLICEPNKYYMETPDDVEEYSQITNLIVEDENGNKKTLIERFNYQSFNNIGVSDGIYYYGENQVKIVAEGKQYLVNNETLDITPKDRMYEDIVFVNEISNKNTGIENKCNITKEELIGNWNLERSNSNITKYSLGNLFGDSLRLANNLEFREDNTYTMSIGVSYYENGKYEIEDGIIKLTDIISGDDSPDSPSRESGEFIIRELEGNKVIIHKEKYDNELIEILFKKN